ncbi:MAG: TonB-dependent receptor [Pedobacter sp.]|nr:MAG: TonB-dependent receptor [Pedobacter sp.]
MKRHLITVMFMLFGCYFSASAQQQIKGKVKDIKGAPIVSVNINLKDKEGSILSFTRTNEKGEFSLSIPADSKELTLEATTIGFEKKIIQITEVNKSYDISLRESEINLKTVEVKNRPQLTTNGDTLNYKTSDFADKQDRTIGDVIKKMPGMEVADNGKISYNGKGISNLYMGGDNLLDDKYSLGTKIPHGAVDKVQVIENDQPIKMLRKNNMSEDVALNLVFKDEAKLKVMGEIMAGLGAPERFDGNVNTMLFKDKLKFINNIKGNNIGIDPGNDLTSFNMADYERKLGNDRPGNLLSAGAAGVPTLPQSRTLFNKAGLINLNNLYKISSDLQVKANVSYLYDQRDQVYNKFSETYLPNQTIRYSEVQENAINPQRLKANFNLNNNAETHYLNNSLALDYAPYSTNSSVTINGIGAFQSLSQKTFDISNEFSYRSVQNDQTASIVSSDMVNDLNWDKSKVYADATYEYSGDKLRATLSLPFSYNNISYNDITKSLDKNLNRFFVNPAFNLKYQSGIENYVTANYAFRNSLGSLDDVYQGTVLKNYRSLFANDAPISESKSHSAGLGFNFRKAMQMFFFNVSAGYSKTTLNTISSYTLTNNIQQRIVLPMANDMESLSLNANASKYLFKLKSTVSAGVAFSQTKFEQLQNNDLLPFTAQTLTYKTGIETKITKFINWSYNANLAVTDNKTTGANAISTQFQQLRQQSSITATVFSRVFLTLAGEHIYTHQASQDNLNYLFADFNARYKFVKLKTDLQFGITNLANVQKFEAINLTANALTSGTYYIPGRVAMLRATFNF